MVILSKRRAPFGAIITGMPTPRHQVQQSYAEYVTLEGFSRVRHEYWDRQIYALPIPTSEHASIVANVRTQLRGCGVVASDLRVRTRSGLTTYADVTIVDGPTQYDAEDRLAITNPAVIVEVLSPSSEPYDRGQKFEHY